MTGTSSEVPFFAEREEKEMEMILGGRKFEAVIDLNVLAEVQEQYGTISEFERKLRGLTPAEEKGHFYIGEPSAKAIAFILPLMINEGFEIEADKLQKYPVEHMSRLEVINMVDMALPELVGLITEELARALAVKKKKQTSTGKKTMKKAER